MLTANASLTYKFDDIIFPFACNFNILFPSTDTDSQLSEVGMNTFIVRKMQYCSVGVDKSFFCVPTGAYFLH